MPVGKKLIPKSEILRCFPGLSARQLKRLQLDHRIGQPVQRHRAGVRGSVSLYPARVIQQIKALRKASRQRTDRPKRLRLSYRRSERSFVLFWDGHDALVPNPAEAIRALLSPIINAPSSHAQNALEDVSNEDEYGGDRALQVVEEHIKGREKALRKKMPLGRMSNADVSSFAYGALSIFFGLPRGGEYVDDSDGHETYSELLFRGCGLTGSNEYPSPFGTVTDAAAWASFINNDMPGLIRTLLNESFLKVLSADDLRTARTAARRFIEDFEVFGKSLSSLVGRNAFGLPRSAKALGSASNARRAMIVLFFAHARRATPENYRVLTECMQRNAKVYRDTLRTYKKLPRTKQKSLRAVIRSAAHGWVPKSDST